MAETRSLLLVTSGPVSGALSAVQLATGMKALGEDVDVCLLQDGVLSTLEASGTPAGMAMARALATGVGVYYLEDDLAARGFGREDARPGSRPLGYGELVELLLDGARKTLGAF
ncbi:MAG: DsrH/TusB family sulfur metabolism protein [Chloroflexota bacterium]